MKIKERDTSLSALLNAIQRNNGYSLHVNAIKTGKGIVYIGLDNPQRTVVVTREVYGKIKEYLILDK